MFGRRSGRYDASAFASVGPNYHKDAVVKPAETAETFLVRIWVVAIEAIGVIERRPRHLERDAVVAKVACSFPVIPLELVVPHGPSPTTFRNKNGTSWRDDG
jgi:hypothetical protein